MLARVALAALAPSISEMAKTLLKDLEAEVLMVAVAATGGNNYDKLVLTTGTYTVGISGATVSFTDLSSIVMNTTQFEQLIAGSATYSFSSLTNGQVVTV
jgi:hypothetical protein